MDRWRFRLELWRAFPTALELDWVELEDVVHVLPHVLGGSGATAILGFVTRYAAILLMARQVNAASLAL